MKYPIWKVKNPNECTDAKTGEAVPFYTFYSDGMEKWDGLEVIERNADSATLEELVWLCDHDAESCNAHDHVGSHRLIGAILFRRFGREAATDAMRDIAYRGGLHAMGGLRGRDDSFEELGVGESGHDWDGTY